MVFKRGEYLTTITERLAMIAMSCKFQGWLKLFNSHVLAQTFFCRFFNSAYGLELQLMDQIRANYPAIDLGDPIRRVAYQITTETSGEKVQHTLDMFTKHGLQNSYDVLRIFVIGDRQSTYKSIAVPESMKFDLDNDIIGMQGFVKYIDTLDLERLAELAAILDQELKPVPAGLHPTPGSQIAGLTFDIGIERDPPVDFKPSEPYPGDRILRYCIAKETINEELRTTITPDVGYLTMLGNGNPIEGVKYFNNPFLCHYPNLDITFVNNTGATVAITEAVFEVVESVPDLSPVIIFRDNNCLMKLTIRNEGWGTVRNAIVKCNLVPTGADDLQPDPPIGHIEIAGPYSHEFALDDFDEAFELDLDSTFAALGVDVAAIKTAGYQSQLVAVMHAMQHGLDANLYQHYGRFPTLETNEAWAAFPDGYAVIAGLIEYDEPSIDGLVVRRSLLFRVRVFLFQRRLDRPMPPSYQYNVMLETDKKKYEAFCPVSHSLQIGEADRIRICIGCGRSATHNLRIRWRLNGVNECVSELIVLRHFVPRTWSKRKQTLVEVGHYNDGSSEQDTHSNMGCVEATARQMFQHATIYKQATRIAPEQEPPGDETIGKP